jgi:Ran GTPase-activating protein (RanGAP) involved in mRNA processing and transport
MKHALYIMIALFLFTNTVNANNSDKSKKTLCGKVLDKTTGEALSGVKIEVKESNTYCYTDLNGNYILTVAADSKTEVVANVVGYEPTSIASSELGYFKDINLSPIQ